MNAHEDLNNLLKEQKDVLLRIYQENRAHERHLEDQRATASNIIVLATVGLIGFMANSGLTCQDWQLSIALIILGVYGAMFTAIYYESIEQYRHRVGKCCKGLEDLLFKELNKEQIQEMFKNILSMDGCAPEEKFPKLRGLPHITKVRALWPLTISIVGVVLTACILFFKCYWRL
jgi:uncharacterized membrane protein YbhN (UPF0104 family)